MLALYVWYGVFLADPVSLVQIRYPASRTTITTASGCNVFYSLSANAPPELRRAYKNLEIAEREVIITDALQQFRVEIVNNERRLEALRTARLALYLSNDIRGPQLRYFDPSVHAPFPSQLKAGLSAGLTSDASIDRAEVALNRLATAHQQLHDTLISIAYPDRTKVAGRPNPTPNPVPAPLPAPVPAVVPAPLAVERAEKTAAEAEAVAAERELTARQNERAAENRYRKSLPADRPAAHQAWLKAREEWENARRDWDAAREKWQAARDQLDAARVAPTHP